MPPLISSQLCLRQAVDSAVCSHSPCSTSSDDIGQAGLERCPVENMPDSNLFFRIEYHFVHYRWASWSCPVDTSCCAIVADARLLWIPEYLAGNGRNHFLILAFQCGGQTHPWSISVMVGYLLGSVAIGAAFVVEEILQSENGRAMLPPRLMRDPKLWPPSLSTFFNAGTFLAIYILLIYFQTAQAVSATKSACATCR